jgi:membrane protease YdiL (CAAX protease family)
VSSLVDNVGSARHRAWRKLLVVVLLTTSLVTALAYLLPANYAATGVGLGFLCATYIVALHHQDTGSSHYGLSLGGILDPEPLNLRRLLRDGARALAWAGACAAVIFPLFWLGFVWWWKPEQPFINSARLVSPDNVLGQLLVIALPEEAFFRGYLQTALDDLWRPRFELLGARLGPGIVLASAIFAAGHMLTEFHPNRLAVFLPALIFGWLRARTGGIGASLAFHAACNLFASFLTQGYGLSH